MARAKAKALSRVPQNRDDAVVAVGRIGTLRREIAARKAAADEQVRIVGEKVEEALAPLSAELAEQEAGLQAWCEVNRATLTADGKVKFHDFGTGRISWRLRPPKVTLRNVEAIIEGCRKLGLKRFLRTRTEINKDAMLADAKTARQIAGVSISSEGEDFIVEPAELDTAQSK